MRIYFFEWNKTNPIHAHWILMRPMPEAHRAECIGQASNSGNPLDLSFTRKNKCKFINLIHTRQKNKIICSCSWKIIKLNGFKGVFINTLVGGGGWAKWRGAKKVLSCQKGGGTKKFSAVNGGSKKFGQIESIMKIKKCTICCQNQQDIASNWIYISKFFRALQRARHCTLHLKCLCSHSFRYTWHLLREPGGAESYRGWL